LPPRGSAAGASIEAGAGEVTAAAENKNGHLHAICQPVFPELSPWAMMILGFAGVGFMAYRRSRKNKTALTAA
jgi:hypothetical protein